MYKKEFFLKQMVKNFKKIWFSIKQFLHLYKQIIPFTINY